MIKYNNKAMTSYGYLMEPYNDIDIYVEDSTYTGIYEKVINRILDGKAKISSVTPLGPKKEVLKKAKEDKNPRNRKRLYIVDGDLDLICYKKQKTPSNVYRLNAYCVENLFIEEQSLEKFIIFCMPDKTREQALSIIDPERIMSNSHVLLPYFISIAIARRLNLRSSVYALNPPSVSKSSNGCYIEADFTKVRKRTLEVCRSIRKTVGRNKFVSNRNLIVQNIKAKSLHPNLVISGKSFLLWYLNNHANSTSAVPVNLKSITSYLADHSTLQNDRKFVQRIKNLAA